MAQLKTAPPDPEEGGEPAPSEPFRQQAQAGSRSHKKRATRVAVLVGVGAILALAGVLGVAAFVVLARGGAVDSYQLGALVVDGVLVVAGLVLTVRNLTRLRRREVAPTVTVEIHQEDGSWIDARTYRLDGDDDTKGYGRPGPGETKS